MIRLTSSASNDMKNAVKSLKEIEKRAPKAFYAALNRAGQETRTEATRQVRATYDVKAGDVRETITIRKSAGNYVLRSKGPNLALIRFKTRPTKVPVRRPKVLKASVKRSGGKPIPGAFVAEMKNGHVGVFERNGKKRTPISQLYGPAVPVMLSGPEISDHLQDKAVHSLQKRLDHEMNRVLGRLNIK